MSTPDRTEPRWLVEQRERIQKADGPFHELCTPWMGIDRGDIFAGRPRLPVYTRLEKALYALREWRNANQQRHHQDDEVSMAIRIVADSMASEIAAAAGDGQDAETIAWVVAGLRCPARPFCLGCPSCFTITAPHRADVHFASTDPTGGQPR